MKLNGTYVREDLAQYLSNAACDACGGSRLNEISRHVQVKDKTIAQITKMSIGDAESYYQDLNLSGAKGEIADKIFKEIRERLHFLSFSRFELFKLVTFCRNPVRW